MKILINISNLHIGGGVQVGSSFLSELSELLKGHSKSFDISVLCSERVYKNLPLDFDKNIFNQFDILNIYGLRLQPQVVKNKFSGFDVCFTVFGPLYFTPKVKKHICGFAQAWIAYPDNIAYQKLSFKEWLKNKIKFKIQWMFFRNYDYLVVEQKHIKAALSKLGYDGNNISVVSNCVSSIYEDKASWLALTFEEGLLVEDITLGFIGRAYPHKNVSILQQVNEILITKYQMKCNFLFTFSEIEMKSCGFSELNNFHSVGEISSMHCPAFYNLLDALVFPSLLECFSASPIEAMKMNTTVIASDYAFVSEVCGEAAFYFDPLSPAEIATTIFNAFSNGELRNHKKQIGNQLVNDLPAAKDRAISYLNIIRDSI
ncbi:MAG: glycosyltransferase involved in cell wall biosynthesis [Mariniflexile sp.]|jgi:glycosyltransferase involved in cell wall biosynthesis